MFQRACLRTNVPMGPFQWRRPQRSNVHQRSTFHGPFRWCRPSCRRRNGACGWLRSTFTTFTYSSRGPIHGHSQSRCYAGVAEPESQANLYRRVVLKKPLAAGALLYKFTDRPLVQSTGRISPWWSSVEPIASGDTGLAGLLERAEGRVSREEFARARSAVTQQWNSMSGLMIIRLLVPAYGFVGRCAAQLVDEQSVYMRNVVFIGGACKSICPAWKLSMSYGYDVKKLRLPKNSTHPSQGFQKTVLYDKKFKGLIHRT